MYIQQQQQQKTQWHTRLKRNEIQAFYTESRGFCCFWGLRVFRFTKRHSVGRSVGRFVEWSFG